jgi:glycosyltransferase involved in cell wall biosynthesis
MKATRQNDESPREEASVVFPSAVPIKRLNVLVLAEEICCPVNSGKRMRTWNLLRRLAKRHSISYLCFGRIGDPGVAELAQTGIQVYLVHPNHDRRRWSLFWGLIVNLFSPNPYSADKHYSGRFRRKLTELLGSQRFDVVHFEGTHCARYLSSIENVPRVVGTHNIESQIWFRRAQQSQSWVRRVFFRSQAIKMSRFERRALLQAEAATAVTAQDAQQMRSWGVSEITLVSNGADLEAYQRLAPATEPSELLFLASLDWFPNLDALAFFLREILPRILALEPKAILRIVGRRPSKALRKLVAVNQHTELVGEVQDVRPYLARAEVVVVPLRIAGGSRLKILEALAAGKAVVSTSIGAEGLELTPGEHFEAVDTPLQFAQRTAALLSNPAMRHRLGENGRRLVTERYGWDGIVPALETAWFKAINPNSTENSVSSDEPAQSSARYHASKIGGAKS